MRNENTHYGEQWVIISHILEFGLVLFFWGLSKKLGFALDLMVLGGSKGNSRFDSINIS